MSVILLFLSSFYLHAQNLNLQIETGAIWQHQNDVKIKPDTGTLVEFDHFNQGPFFHHRIEAFYIFNKKHKLRAELCQL